MVERFISPGAPVIFFYAYNDMQTFQFLLQREISRIYHSRILRDCFTKHLFETDKQYLTFTLFNTWAIFTILSQKTVNRKTTGCTHMIAWSLNTIDISAFFLTWCTAMIEFFISITYFSIKS